MADYFNKNLLGNVEEILDMVRLNFDGVLLIDGMEGSGKSELGKQICMKSDKNFTANDVFYTTEQFEEWLDTAPPGKAGLWDEFVMGGLSTDALSKMQNLLIKRFTMIRKKRLIIVLVIPYIFLLRKYFAIARTRCLIHVYAKGKERGHFKFYNYQEKLWIYNYGYKTWLYSPKVKSSFEGKFQAWSEKYIDEKIIQEKKDQAIRDLENEEFAIKLTHKKIKYLQDHAEIKVNADYKTHSKEYKALHELVRMIRDFNVKL